MRLGAREDRAAEKSRFLTPFAEDANGFGMTRAGEAARGVETAVPHTPDATWRSGAQSGREKQVPHAVR